MSHSALHAEPSRPFLNASGVLANPIGGDSSILLSPKTPIRYSQLLPSACYTDGTIEYLTDDDGMPARVRGVLRLLKPGDVVRHPKEQAEIGHLALAPGKWHGGHIVAATLGGFGSGPNLFPQSATFNQSAYRRFENSWSAALREGNSVAVDIGLTTGARPLVPDFVLVSCWENSQSLGTTPLLDEPNVQ